MKFLTTLALGAVISTEVLGAAIPRPQEPLSNAPAPQAQEKYLVELGPDRTRWVTEEEKWALKLVCLPSYESCLYLTLFTLGRSEIHRRHRRLPYSFVSIVSCRIRDDQVRQLPSEDAAR